MSDVLSSEKQLPLTSLHKPSETHSSQADTVCASPQRPIKTDHVTLFGVRKWPWAWAGLAVATVVVTCMGAGWAAFRARWTVVKTGQACWGRCERVPLTLCWGRSPLLFDSCSITPLYSWKCQDHRSKLSRSFKHQKLLSDWSLTMRTGSRIKIGHSPNRRHVSTTNNIHSIWKEMIDIRYWNLEKRVLFFFWIFSSHLSSGYSCAIVWYPIFKVCTPSYKSGLSASFIYISL